jgi:hypothetical protein
MSGSSSLKGRHHRLNHRRVEVFGYQQTTAEYLDPASGEREGSANLDRHA